MSRVSSACALPEKTFNSPKPVAMKGSPITYSLANWLGRKDSNLRIRDPKSRALPLGHAPTCPRRSHLTRFGTLSTDLERKADLRSGLNYVAQTVSVYDGLFQRQGTWTRVLRALR